MYHGRMSDRDVLYDCSLDVKTGYKNRVRVRVRNGKTELECVAKNASAENEICTAVYERGKFPRKSEDFGKGKKRFFLRLQKTRLPSPSTRRMCATCSVYITPF